MLIQVLRLETDSRRGPYTGGAGVAWEHTKHTHNQQPAPRNDGLENFDRSRHFGFRSAEQMRDWFSAKENDEKMEARGVQVSTYEVDEKHVQFGGRQLVFNPREAIMVDRQPLENY